MSAGPQLAERTAGVPPDVDGQSAERHVFVVCSGEACLHAGSGGLLGLLRRRRPEHERSRDVRVGVSRCIGRCTMAPAMVEDGHVLGWVSLRRLRCELIRLGLGVPEA